MKQLFKPQAANRLAGIGAALSALDSGNAVDLSGYIANQQALQQQLPMSGGGSMVAGMSGESPLDNEALMAKFTPEQQAMLAQMPRAAAMKIIEQAVFAKPDPSAVWRSNLERSSFYQGLSPEQQAGIMMLPPAEAQKIIAEMIGPQEVKDRKTIKAADGFTYYMDNGERVLPDVQAPAGTVQLSPEEIAAAGLDPSKAYQRKADGTISMIGGGGVTVENNIGGGSKFDEETDKLLAKETAEIASAGATARRGMVRIGQLERVLENSPQGIAGGAVGLASRLGIKVSEGQSDYETAQAIISSLVPEQRQPGSGPMSDADLELFKLSLPRMMNTPEGNQQVIATLREIAQYDIQRADIARKLQTRQISREDAFTAYDALANPLEGFVEPSPEPESGGNGEAAGMTFEQFSAQFANNPEVKEALEAGVSLKDIYNHYSGGQ